MRVRFLPCIGIVAALSAVGAQPTATRVRLVEDLRLDANTEDFSALSQIFVGPRREIIVPLRQDMQIRMYDSTGKRIAVVGRRGAGPGEFQQMSVIGWAAETLTAAGSGAVQEKQRAWLRDIIAKLNDLFEGDLSDQDKLVYVNNVLKGKLLESDTLVQQASNNTKDQCAMGSGMCC